MLTAPEMAPSHQDLPLSLLSCPATDSHPCPPALTIPTHTGHISPSHLVSSICHITPCPPHHQPSPSQDTLQQSRSLTEQPEQRTSPSLPQLPVFPPPTSTPVDIYLKKKFTFEAKTHVGAGCWEEGAFSVHAVQTLQQAALSQLGSLHTNVASLLTCYLKPVPRLAHSGFRLRSWSHQGWAVSLSPAQCQVPPQQSSCLLHVRPAHSVTAGSVLLLNLRRLIP